MSQFVMPAGQRRITAIVISLIMVAYVVLRQWHTAQVIPAVLQSVVAYFLAVAVFYGVARLAYGGTIYPIVGMVLGALILESYIAGYRDLWLTVTTWGMVLAVGLTIGRLSRAQVRPGKVFIVGLLITVAFCTIQYAPYWGKLMDLASTKIAQMIDTAQQSLKAAGDTPAMVHEKVTTARRIIDVMIRLLPAGTILGTLTQYSVAYLVFVRWASRHGMSLAGFRPFFEWKMPFAFMPVIMVVIVIRLLGNDSAAIFADNALAMASIFYCLTGLALMEFVLRKLRLTRLMKILFYIFLFISQFVGFFAAALLGLIDSFADWRKVKPANAG